MASNISDKERAEMEEFIRQHPPYANDDETPDAFDGDADPDRHLSRIFQKILNGELK